MPDHEGRDPIRPLYLAGELFDWIDAATDLFDPRNGAGRRSPFEHLERTFSDFRCCARPFSGDLRCLMPQRKRVWSMHSPCLRILGWIPAPHRFVGVYAVRIGEAHGKGSRIDEFRDKVIAFATRHGLAPTIQSGNLNALFPSQA